MLAISACAILVLIVNFLSSVGLALFGVHLLRIVHYDLTFLCLVVSEPTPPSAMGTLRLGVVLFGFCVIFAFLFVR